MTVAAGYRPAHPRTELDELGGGVTELALHLREQRSRALQLHQ